MIGILIWVVIFVTVNELAAATVYGKFLADEVVFNYLNEYKEFHKNQFDDSILSPKIDLKNMWELDNLSALTDHRFIAKVPFGITSRYYISRVGRVPRWSKMHNVITELYKKSNTTEL